MVADRPDARGRRHPGRAGRRGDDLFLLLDGVLAVSVDGDEVAEIGPGAILGELASLGSGKRTATLSARTKCRVAVVPADLIDREGSRTSRRRAWPWASRCGRRSPRTGDAAAFAVWEIGGFPVLTLHGTPGSQLGRWPRELYRELGVCLVHDRAGCSRSERRHGRAVVDEDGRRRAGGSPRLRAGFRGLRRFGRRARTSSRARRGCRGRVARATCIVGIAPLGTPGLERDAWVDGMDPRNVEEFDWALAGEDVLAVELAREHDEIASAWRRTPRTSSSSS